MNYTKVNLEQLEALSKSLSTSKEQISTSLSNIKGDIKTITTNGYMLGASEDALSLAIDSIAKSAENFGEDALKLIDNIEKVVEKSQAIDKEEAAKEGDIFGEDPLSFLKGAAGITEGAAGKVGDAIEDVFEDAFGDIGDNEGNNHKGNGGSLPSDWQSPMPVLYYGVSTPKNVTQEQREVYTYLSGMGLNDAAIAGIMGNIQQESGFNTRMSAMDTNGYRSDGLFAWNERYTTAWKYGTSVNSQMNYMESTLDSNTLNKLKNVPNSEYGAQQAALIFAQNYERCAKSSYTKRQTNAVAYYRSF